MSSNVSSNGGSISIGHVSSSGDVRIGHQLGGRTQITAENINGKYILKLNKDDSIIEVIGVPQGCSLTIDASNSKISEIKVNNSVVSVDAASVEEVNANSSTVTINAKNAVATNANSSSVTINNRF